MIRTVQLTTLTLAFLFAFHLNAQDNYYDYEMSAYSSEEDIDLENDYSVSESDLKGTPPSYIVEDDQLDAYSKKKEKNNLKVQSILPSISSTLRKENSSKYLVNLYYGNTKVETSPLNEPKVFESNYKPEADAGHVMEVRSEIKEVENKVQISGKGLEKGFFHLMDNKSNATELAITNSLGKIVRNIDPNKLSKNKEIDLSELPSGYYQLMVKCADCSVYFEKIYLSDSIRLTSV